MKKLMLSLLVLCFGLTFCATVFADVETSYLYVHYYRYAGDYTNWNAWVWQAEPTSKEGASYEFVADDTEVAYNYGGMVAKIALTGDLADTSKAGILIRKGNWDEKDVATDRFISIPDATSDGIAHAYFVEGDARVGTSRTDAEGPDRFPKFKTAYFTALNTIAFTATEDMAPADIVVKAGNVTLVPLSIITTGSTGVITLSANVDFSIVYTIQGTFDDASVNTYIVTFDGIYDSEEFETAFTYAGDDLGAVVSTNLTSFRVWAPVASEVTLNLYSTGTPESLGGTDVPTQTIPMTKGINGTYFTTVASNLHGTYYTYSVKNGSATNETIDPYAKSCGINGLRGLVVDFSQTNPLGFSYDDRADNMEYATDAIIYELHVRDLTSHSSWTGTEANRSRYLGLSESGTTYNGVSTGFDHIVDLGVTHVQLLPIFDFGVLDESKIDTTDYNSFNWGYMPLNFNCLEGSYSADPEDGLSRISEFKTVVAAYTDANLRINMDVVYNHTGLTADSNFSFVVPGYYYRKTASGAYSNGSGTGNETASDRSMMQKFIVDSVCFWAEEYNISGFRFDLMALHDIETMALVETELHAIDPTILVYGEPWMGGTSTLPESEQAGKANLATIGTVAAFNDDLRDGVKGSVFAKEEGGFVQGSTSSGTMSKVKYGIVGGIAFDGIIADQLSRRVIWHTSPLKTINYVTCHDNNTLYDKLYLTLEATDRLSLIPAMSKQSNAIVLTSQGISFLHAGDEILRSKPLASGTGFDHNSYSSPDSVNQIRWDQKLNATNLDVYEYYQGLIALRKAHASFRMTTALDVTANLEFVYEDKTGVIAYTITNEASADAYETILVIHNANEKVTRLSLPKNGGWVAVVNGEDAGTTTLDTYKGGETLRVAANSSMVLYQDVSIPDVNYTGIIIASVAGGLMLIGAAIFLFLKFRKKI